MLQNSLISTAEFQTFAAEFVVSANVGVMYSLCRYSRHCAPTSLFSVILICYVHC